MVQIEHTQMLKSIPTRTTNTDLFPEKQISNHGLCEVSYGLVSRSQIA